MHACLVIKYFKMALWLVIKSDSFVTFSFLLYECVIVNRCCFGSQIYSKSDNQYIPLNVKPNVLGMHWYSQSNSNNVQIFWRAYICNETLYAAWNCFVYAPLNHWLQRNHFWQVLHHHVTFGNNDLECFPSCPWYTDRTREIKSVHKQKV